MKNLHLFLLDVQKSRVRNVKYFFSGHFVLSLIYLLSQATKRKGRNWFAMFPTEKCFIIIFSTWDFFQPKFFMFYINVYMFSDFMNMYINEIWLGIDKQERAKQKVSTKFRYSDFQKCLTLCFVPTYSCITWRYIYIYYFIFSF